MQNIDWYNTLIQPSLTPPDRVFMIVWPILYTMMAVSFILMLRTPVDADRTKAVRYFFGQLFFNFLWSPVFFMFKNPAGALVVLILLLFFLYRTIFLFYQHSKTAAFLLLPYAVWGMFALYLNIGIVVLN